MRQPRPLLSSAFVFLASCTGGTGPLDETGRLELAAELEPRAVVVGAPVSIDVRPGFLDGRGLGLTFTATFTPPAPSLSLANGHVSGTPSAPGVTRVRVVARDAAADSLAQTFAVVAFAPGLPSPTLPAALLPYSDARAPIPQHYTLANAPGGSALAFSNTPPGNATTDAGATLGRVLFYDTRLSANDGVSCASCHLQEFGFTDTARFSRGFAGGTTARHSMSIANARFYQRARFFWDERAATLEDQVLRPIQDPVEMGLALDDLVLKLRVTSFYAPLFQSAFGSTTVTAERVSLAMAQYVRSIISYGSRFDSTFAPGAQGPNLSALTPQEVQGFNVFNGQGRCAQCHATNAHVSDNLHNTGLDAVVTDPGAGNGRFKSPSLRNVEVRGRFMHDGRFTSLEQVVDFYNTGIQPNPFLDPRLRIPGSGVPMQLGLTPGQRDALVAYLRTLTDRPLLSDARFSNPFGSFP